MHRISQGLSSSLEHSTVTYIGERN